MFSVKPTAFDLFDYCEKCYSPKTVWLKCLSVSSCDASKYVTSTVIGISPTISMNRICLWSHTRLIAISRRTQGASQPFWIKKFTEYYIQRQQTQLEQLRMFSNSFIVALFETMKRAIIAQNTVESEWKHGSLLIDARSLARAVFITPRDSQQFSNVKVCFLPEKCLYACGIVDVHCVLLIWLPHRLESKRVRAFRCMRRGAFTRCDYSVFHAERFSKSNQLCVRGAPYSVLFGSVPQIQMLVGISILSK